MSFIKIDVKKLQSFQLIGHRSKSKTAGKLGGYKAGRLESGTLEISKMLENWEAGKLGGWEAIRPESSPYLTNQLIEPAAGLDNQPIKPIELI